MEFENWIPLIENKLERWWEYFVKMLPNMVLALLVLVLFFIGARLVRKVSNQFVLSISKSASVSGLISGILYGLVIIFGLMTALDIVQLEKTVSSLLAGVGIIGLALGFAFQDLTSNFISGAFIALRRPFDVGHTVETNGFVGTVEEIQLRSTTLQTSAGLHVIIPNKDIFQKPIINYSRSAERRVELEFNIPNTIDVAFAEDLVHEAIGQIHTEGITKDIEVYFTAIEHPNLKVNVSFWTTSTKPREFMHIRHKAIVAICQAFADRAIYEVQIPKPTNAETNATQKG